jgi:probable H4MPT-linked C1 transfer pathway protein
VLGLDIGGANTKAAYVQTKKGTIKDVQIVVEYFPIWKQSQKMGQVLQKIKETAVGQFDAVGVTMTAELCDVYQTKRDGVKHILDCVKEVFSDVPIYILNSDAHLETLEEALSVPLGVAAANWAATGWIVLQYFESCVVVDVGSTSTSIIPIVGGELVAQGKTDLDKLVYGELVYTGSLRTNLAAIVQTVPVKGAVSTVSSELFALSGDVHIILGNIKSEQYVSETADGKGATRTEALTRLARLVCADTEMLTEKDLTIIAQHIYEKQVQQITAGLSQVYSRVKNAVLDKVPVLVAGLGKDFLARKAAEQVGVDVVLDLGELLSNNVSLAVPAVGVALMTAKHVEEENCGV